MKKFRVTTIYRVVHEVEAYDEQDAFDKTADLNEIELDMDTGIKFDIDDYWIDEIG